MLLTTQSLKLATKETRPRSALKPGSNRRASVNQGTCLSSRQRFDNFSSARSLHAAATASSAASCGGTDQDVSQDDWFAAVCGEYPVQEVQLKTFEKFSATLKQAGTAFAAVAVTNVLLTLLKDGSSAFANPLEVFARTTVGNFSLWADSIVVAGLTYYGAGAFQSVLESDCPNKLPRIFQGISRLTVVLQQLGLAAAALGAVHMLEAATVFPRITRIAAVLFISVSASRGLLLRWLSHRHPEARGGILPEMVGAINSGESSGVPLWERRAMRYVVGHFASFNVPSAEEGRQPMPQNPTQDEQDSNAQSSSQARTQDDGGDKESEGPPSYYFNRAELQLVRICIDAMHFAGFALGSQGIATALLGLACLGSGQFVQAFSMASNGASKVFSSMLLFGASTAFDRTFVIPSCHVCNLVDGVGPGGLTDLFHKLTLFSWSVVASQVLQLSIPWLRNSPLRMLVAGEVLGPHITQALTVAQNVLAGV